MLRNYFKTAIRNLLRYKGFSIINISSLMLGITSCLVIGLFVWDERQYDKSIPGGENIYRIYEQRNNNNSITYAAVVPPAFTGFLRTQYPEVEAATRIMMIGDKYLLEKDDKRNYEEKGWFVDSNFFEIFRLGFVKGDPLNALNTPNSIVISEALAKKYFGREDPIGKSIRMNKEPYTIKGVLAKLPEHFHLQFEYLMPLSAIGLPRERMERWTWHQFYSYIKLKPGANAKLLQEKFQAHVKKEIFPTLTQQGSTFLPMFQPLHDVHLKSADFIYDNAIRGNEKYVNALTIIAVFILVIACFNFINLATARSFRRAREIGVRKVIGARRKQLIIQFIGETILLSLIAMILSVVATLLVIPLLNQFSGKAIAFNPFTDPFAALIVSGGGILIGMLAGIYPALILSGFQPIKVLKSMKLTGLGSGAWLRHSLVAIQFGLSILLIISTIIVYRQTKYMNNADLGFNNDQVVYFQVRDEVQKNLETFKSELLRSPGIVSVTSGYGLPGDQYAGDGVIVPGNEGEKEFSSNVFIGDHDYIKTLGLRIIVGRDFSKEMKTDLKEAFIINETAAREFGFGTPAQALGKRIYWNEWEPADSLNTVKKGRVIGVVQDFHYKSLHEKITASVIHLYPAVVFKLAVKLRTANVDNTIAYINSVWNKFSPGYPLDYKFMDETYGKMYMNENKLSTLLWIFTVMAIVVGCMGLFGLSAFSAEQRAKELGIRKILGASAFDIVGLLSRNFVLMILASGAIALPLAWIALNSWLKDFPYRVNIAWWIFALGIIAALLIAMITISFQAIRAAFTSPIKSLRTE
jgi:putative ABC transport system permease protein